MSETNVQELTEQEFKAQCLGYPEPPSFLKIREKRWLKLGRALGIVAFDGIDHTFFAVVMLPACACDIPCGSHFGGPIAVSFKTEEDAAVWLKGVMQISNDEMSKALKSHLARSN